MIIIGGFIMKNNCIDCGKELSRTSYYQHIVRCKSCAAKNRPKKERIHCIDCNKELGRNARYNGTKRCRLCYYIRIKISKNTPNYKKGNWIKKYYCCICKKKISLDSGLLGRGQCQKCYLKNHKFTKEIRKILSLSHGGTGIPYEHNLYPIEFHEIRLKILQRDNYICKICNKIGNQVHHIDYNKENNKENNLITLCKKCNIRANYNREKWIKILKKI